MKNANRLAMGTYIIAGQLPSACEITKSIQIVLN